MEDDDAPLELSAEARAALSSFLAEREQLEAAFQAISAKTEKSFEERAKRRKQIAEAGMDLFREDWQLSQFWYSKQTAQDLADLVIRSKPESVACISTPTLFAALYAHPEATGFQTTLFEYDDRFSVYEESFVHFDYRAPLDALPKDQAAQGSFDVIVMDPPFLSEECMTKTSAVVRYLAAPNARIVACTGAVMKSIVAKELGLAVCRYRPQHANNLSNDFRCYANFFEDESMSGLGFVKDDGTGET